MSERLVFVYVATGAAYVEEARRSALSCRAHAPSSRIVLFTPDDCDPGGFDDVIPFGSDLRDRPFELKIAGILAACETQGPRAVFLDSDTCVIGDVTDLGEILDRFDLAAAHAPVRLRSNVEEAARPFLAGAPASYPEFNTGVIAFRCAPPVREMLSAWRDLYREHMERAPHLFHNRHQPSFRAAVYRSDLRVATLPPEYNCVFRRPVGLCGPVKILHGRGDYAVLAEHLNGTLTFRSVTTERYLPELIVVR